MERGLEFFNLALGELRKQAGQMVQLVQIFILAQIVIEPQHIAVKAGDEKFLVAYAVHADIL